MRVISSAVLFAALVIGLPAAAQDFTSSDIYPSTYPTVRAVAYMAELIRERSDGHLALSNLGADDPETENFTLGQLRNGTLDMARVNLAALNSTVPDTVVLTLPYLFRSTDHERKVLDGPIGDEILASLERAGVIGLCFYDTGTRSTYGTKPVRTPSDLRALKYRVQQSSYWTRMVRILGAQAVVLPLSHVEAGLRTGAIDVADGNWSSFVASRHHRVAQFFSLTQHIRSPGVLLFSRRVWETLSPNDRAIIRLAARDSVVYYRRLWDEHEAAARRTAEAAGVKVVSDIDYEGFRSAMVPRHDTAVSDARLKSLIVRIKASETP